jgi:uncharacterized protein YqgC (DUF456 family)
LRTANAAPAAYDSGVTAVLWVIAVVLIGIGIVGIVMPALPGTILIFFGVLLAAWADHFTRISGWTVGVIGVIAAASYAVDFVAAALGAKTLGASRRAMVGAGLGTIAGLFFGIPGIIVGPFVGAVIGELTVHADWRRAGKAGASAWLGFVIGMAVKVALAFVMLGIFVAAVIF